MFGTYRTFLALAVVFHHLLSVPVIGHYAVHGFFILSGYLMTYIMSESYGYSLRGIRSFALNRWLRLYPPYFFMLAVSVFIVWYFGDEVARSFRGSIFMPGTVTEWMQNISLIYFDLFPYHVTPRLSPPTWALTVELLFYLVIALGASRTRTLTTIWFALGGLYLIGTHYYDMSYKYRYGMVLAGSFPFSLGAMIYHYRDVLQKMLRNFSGNGLGISLFALLILNSAAAIVIKKANFPDGFFYASYYVNYLVNALIVVWLIRAKLPISHKVDKFIGDFSYPVYLLHWQVGLASSMLLWGEPVRGMSFKGTISFLLACALCMLVSLIVIKLVDEPVEKVRKRIKSRARRVEEESVPERSPGLV